MKKSLAFTKMHGLGNDFMLVNGLTQPLQRTSLPVAALSERHLGIGFDQLLIVEPSKGADAACLIYNADGSEAEQCGNGLRCVARFLHEEGLIRTAKVLIETKAGCFDLVVDNYSAIKMLLNYPELKVEDFILASDTVSKIHLGNPHAIIRVEDILNVQPASVSALHKHPLFPNGVNVGFVEILNRSEIRLRTFERGVGETNACGSNACAAVVTGILKKWLDNEVAVHLRHGVLEVQWFPNQPIVMTGPATRVYEGVITI